MSGGAVIVARQNRTLRAFREAGATAADRARTPAEVGVSERSFVFRRFVALNVVLRAAEGRCYLDAPAAEAFLRRRRTRVLIAVAVAIGVVVVMLR